MRLAHCSDLHLLSHDGAGWWKLANKRWIGAANLLTNRSRHYHVAAFEQMVDDLNAQGIEHVLCTGDVTNLALEQEFLVSRASGSIKLAADLTWRHRHPWQSRRLCRRRYYACSGDRVR